MRRLTAHGVPAGKVRGVAEALEAAASAGDPATVMVEHPTNGPLPLVKSPIHLGQAPQTPAKPPPLLGEHTAEVVREIGCDPDFSPAR